MGMFDYVTGTDGLIDCPMCGGTTSGFQTKDYECDLVEVPVDMVFCMIGQCDNCGHYVSAWRGNLMDVEFEVD